MTGADHEESSPDASTLLITKLSCSLVGSQQKVRFEPGTQIHRIYGVSEAMEDFACNYGFNARYLDHLQKSAWRISGTDDEDGIRVVELPGHRFFLATLYLPQMNSVQGKPHPLILNFVRAAL